MVWLINPNHPEGLCISCLSCSYASPRFAILATAVAAVLLFGSPKRVNDSLFHCTAYLRGQCRRCPAQCFAVAYLSYDWLLLCESTQFHSVSARTHASASTRYALALLSKSKPSLRLTPLFISLAYRTISLPQPLTSFLPVALAAPVTSMLLRSFSILSHCFSVLFCAVP